MQQKNVTEENLIDTKHHLKYSTTANNPALPVVVLIYPADDSFLPMQSIRRVAVWPGVTYLVVKCGPAAVAADGDLCAALQEHTIIPVVEAERDMPMEPNHVYVVRPEMTASRSRQDDVLRFRAAFPAAHGDGAIEVLLASVAAVAADRHIVLLTRKMAPRLLSALRVVRDQGGFSIELADDDPFYPAGGAMASDLTLSVTEAVAKVQSLLTLLKKQAPLLPGTEAEKTALTKIYLLLLQQRGIDFCRHRQKEVLRRIQRRMSMNDISKLELYASLLSDDGEEMDRLFEDLRISPTGFFLDAPTEYALLNDVMPGVLSRRQDDFPLRIWIPCCTSGQMAYSLAIFLLEYLRARKLDLPVQIFATDLNKAAIDRARIGAYQAAELAGMAARKRKRYFTRLPHGGHRVNQAIRDMCIFATHNLRRDPPFSHVDILIAGSALAGLDQDSRDRIFRHFHYALTPCGYMLPGNSGEGPQNFPAGLFRRLRATPCILTKNEITDPLEPLLPAQPIRKPGEQEANDMLLSSYVPPTLLVDEQLRIVRFYGQTEPYLRQSPDHRSLHLLRMVRDELVFELDELIERSVKENKTVTKEGIRIGSGENSRPLSIEVTPLRNLGSRWKLIIIREIAGPAQPASAPYNHGRPLTSKDIRILRLEKEANELRALLIAANQESARAQEALQHANEDILASNEELTSVNEQLHSVNRHLLSLNVELNKVNEDLHLRNRELQASMDYAYAIVNSIHRPLAVVQNDLRIRLANPSFYYFFGLPETQIQGQSLYTIAGGVLDREDLRKAIRRTLAKKLTSADLELRLDFPGQQQRIMNIGIARMRSVKNIPTGLILSLEDITEKTMMDKFRDDFIGIASHELKTPATTIQAYSQLLYEELTTTRDPQSAELVKKLNNQVSRLTHLTKDLLDVTRISQGQDTLKKERLDPDELIAETVEELQVTTDIRLVITGHPPLPIIRGDRERLEQVLTNLLTNAIKYAPDSREILIHADAEADKVNISIQDFGAGMSMESRRKIFDRFYRLEETAAGRFPGVGLGLYIASEIIRRHGGEITVSSQKDKGSVFTVSLPVN